MESGRRGDGRTQSRFRDRARRVFGGSRHSCRRYVLLFLPCSLSVRGSGLQIERLSLGSDRVRLLLSAGADNLRGHCASRLQEVGATPLHERG